MKPRYMKLMNVNFKDIQEALGHASVLCWVLGFEILLLSRISSKFLLLLQSSGNISEMEREMDSLYESAGLFEVNVPDYKQLKACRR